MSEPDDDELEDFPPERSPGRRWLSVLGVLLVLGLLAVGVAGAWALRQVNPSGGPGAEVAIEIPRGSSTARIAALLDAEGVITSARVFRLYVRVNGGGDWQAGRYTFRRNSEMGEVVEVLDGGPEVAVVRFTVPEGFTLEQIGARVGSLPGRSAERFLELARSGTVRSSFQPQDGTNLEGLLFPDTYVLDADATEEDILRAMVGRFDAVATELGLAEAPARVGLSAYQVTIVASMIEREARIPDERGMVARVVYNRLERRIRLGIDATIRYELGKPSGPLLRSELERDTPYNTRTRAGLPPTPIAAPGRASLEAAMNPTPGDWIYYVIADEDGRHTFVVTDAEFQRAKRAAQAKGLI